MIGRSCCSTLGFLTGVYLCPWLYGTAQPSGLVTNLPAPSAVKSFNSKETVLASVVNFAKPCGMSCKTSLTKSCPSFRLSLDPCSRSARSSKPSLQVVCQRAQTAALVVCLDFVVICMNWTSCFARMFIRVLSYRRNILGYNLEGWSLPYSFTCNRHTQWPRTSHCQLVIMGDSQWNNVTLNNLAFESEILSSRLTNEFLSRSLHGCAVFSQAFTFWLRWVFYKSTLPCSKFGSGSPPRESNLDQGYLQPKGRLGVGGSAVD